jgi:N-acetyl-anhydromuramyl-L-alanine amidase AmpD
MERVNTVDYGLEFSSLTPRYQTNFIVIHHSGTAEDMDLSAEDIHQMHQNQGWAGCGYHFVIRKDGTIELGRPVDCVGAHAEGYNYESIGVHLSGNFELDGVEPTDAQIESCAMLLANLCSDYGLEINRQTILGHYELNSTDCPGRNAINQLDTIVGKANFYFNS